MRPRRIIPKPNALNQTPYTRGFLLFQPYGRQHIAGVKNLFDTDTKGTEPSVTEVSVL